MEKDDQVDSELNELLLVAKSLEAEPFESNKNENRLGAFDLSSDNDIGSYLESKFNEYSKPDQIDKPQQNFTFDVKQALLKFKQPTSLSQQVHNLKNNCNTKTVEKSSTSTNLNSSKQLASKAHVDFMLGMRIVNPLISTILLKERMAGKKIVTFYNLPNYIKNADLTEDWVICGALVSKSPVRTTKKGDQFSIWRLSDLRGQILMVSLFLFRNAHKDLWKTTQGMCIAILNPNTLGNDQNKEKGEIASLSIDTSQKVVILGNSKDLGTCKGRKKNGEACKSVVNLSECDTCIYHMKQEYSKISRRPELQSSRNGFNKLQNKDRNQLFPMGNLDYMVPARQSAKFKQKDTKTLDALSNFARSSLTNNVNQKPEIREISNFIPYIKKEASTSKAAADIDSGIQQRYKDLERLKALRSESINSNSTNLHTIFPKLSRDDFICEAPLQTQKVSPRKARAVRLLKGSIEKIDPNSLRGSVGGKRRAIDKLNDSFNDAKRQKIDKEKTEHMSRIQRIMATTSLHKDLIDDRQKDEEDKYFNKLEKKETLENKMLSTYKVPCKAVICAKCKYTAFSAADRCKEEKHPLKVIDAVKRFYQCKDCTNRTATVFKFPQTSCTNCNGSRWERTAMIRDNNIRKIGCELSVRGDEEKFLGSTTSKANINLLLPDN